jgi:hypothetical protein
LVRREIGPALRARVADAFRDLAHGVDASRAHEQAMGFYRSGGQAWSQALDRHFDHDGRSRVAVAFRAMAHGVGDAIAHARALQFYRSSGHAWARNLG